MTSWDLWAIGAVLLMGIPHGGLDGAIARRVGWPRGWVGWLAFNLFYLMLVALVVWVWWQWPLVSLAAFLFISALHFGASDIADTKLLAAKKTDHQWLPLIAHGGLVVVVIPSLQPLKVQPLFTLLVDKAGADMLMQSISFIFLP